MGNPTRYLGATMTWAGKQLKYWCKSGKYVNFAYNEDGIRTLKNSNGVVTNYYYNGSLLIGMTVGSGSSTKILRFSYDASGNVVAVDYSTDNGSTFNTYYYLRNAQNDIVKLIDSSGSTVVEYCYDSWGKLLSTSGSLASTLGKNDPFRYRGYVYDEETEFYYVQSRYYNPEIGRWISPEPNADYGGFDEGAGLLGYNVYAYCANNPVNNFDPDGEAVANIVGGIIGGVAGAALGALLAQELGLSGWKKALFIVGLTAAGAALGAFLGPYMAKLGGKIASMLKSAASSFKATVQGARTAIKHSKTVTKLINNASQLKRSKTVMSHLSSRPYTDSTLTIQNIMKAVKPMADSSLKDGLKWVVNGTYNGSSGVWELVVDTITNTIVHFLFRSK